MMARQLSSSRSRDSGDDDGIFNPDADISGGKVTDRRHSQTERTFGTGIRSRRTPNEAPALPSRRTKNSFGKRLGDRRTMDEAAELDNATTDEDRAAARRRARRERIAEVQNRYRGDQ